MKVMVEVDSIQEKLKNNTYVYVSSALAPYDKYTIQNNIEKAQNYCKMLLIKGFVPIVPHLMYGFLDNNDPKQRQLGFDTALKLLPLCDYVNMYTIKNYISKGMQTELDLANKLGIKVNTFDFDDKEI